MLRIKMAVIGVKGDKPQLIKVGDNLECRKEFHSSKGKVDKYEEVYLCQIVKKEVNNRAKREAEAKAKPKAEVK